MRKFILFLGVIFSIIACSNNNDENICDEDNLVTASSIFATIDSTFSYTGPIEVYPCIANTTIYQGNYSSLGARSVIPAYYYISQGVGQATNYPVREPIGTYSLIYWGYPNWMNQALKLSNVQTQGITLGGDLSKLNFSLVPLSISDTLYYPVYDLVTARQTLNIDTDNLSANFKRVTAGLNILINNSDNTAFSSTIDSMWVYIGGINYQLNFVTGSPTNVSYKTITRGLSANSARTQYSSDSTYVFPSAPNPPMQLFVKLSTGVTKNFQTNLSSQLTAGTFTTLVIYLNGLMIEKNNTGTFTVDGWVEQKDSITFPVI